MVAAHRSAVGETVTVFQMTPAQGLMIEGKAVIQKIIGDMDERYKVRFVRKDGKLEREQVERFVDQWGQKDPERYVREFNRKHSIA
jgi:hypothetical protein